MTRNDGRIAALSGAVISRLEALLSGLAALLLAVLLALVITNAGLRYLLHVGLVGAEELAIWLQVAMIALAAPLALNGPLAMRLDALTTRLPQALKAPAGVMADAMTTMAALVLLFGGATVARTLGGISPTLGLPEGLRFGFLAGGGGLLLALLTLSRLSAGRGRALFAALVIGAALHSIVPFLSVETDLPPSLFLALAAAIGLACGAPLPHAFLAAAHAAIAFGSPQPEAAIVSTTVTGLSKFLLLAIPFFLLAGGLLTGSGAAGRLVRLAASLVGHRRAGLAQTTLLTSVLFSGASGSSVANAAFGAATFQPELARHGHRPAEAGALIAATSVLDNVIPPSIAFLILAAATNLSVGALLTGGLAAGGVMALCLAVAIHLSAGRRGTAMPRATTQERRAALAAALPALGLGVIVVAGIRFGVVTTTEAAGLAALYTLGLAMAAGLRFRAIAAVFRQSAGEAAAVGMLIGTAAPFAFQLAVDDVAGLVTHLVTLLGGSAGAVLLLANLVLLAAGLVLDIGAAILLLGPILLPAAMAAGIDPVAFGVILVVNLMIHGLTPPLGMLVYVVAGVTGVPAGAIFRAVTPYLAALLVALALISIATLLFL
ncbi:TRAP transporter large permease subunit [Rhizobium sp. RU20A]|uniref:TRAP transporter large permease subunit n=1 Tax=Rhizobium sp. RU20A TaxID=1907412 RepID=UPI001FCE8517|nr:TRAP transporter large permease subunit [Rhizobium sp. RU20A]